MRAPIIPFNEPYFVGTEVGYIQEVIRSKKNRGELSFITQCQLLLEKKYGFDKVLLTTSCTHALEMCAILIDTKDGDEIIIPSYTYISTANAFVLRGAHIVFADSDSATPNIDVNSIEALITPKTKAIVCVHYAGMACNMDLLLSICNKHNLFLIEDAAPAINSYYKGKALGSFGHLAAFSFHETKNISCGEGGMLVINDSKFVERAAIILEKGTNRNQFLKGEIKQYEWVDIGSSYKPSEVTAAILYAQLEQVDEIQLRREIIWDSYHKFLEPMEQKGFFTLAQLPRYASNNAHTFYLICKSSAERDGLIAALLVENIKAVFHYQALHQSPYYMNKHDERILGNSEIYANCLLRLPLFVALSSENVKRICDTIQHYFNKTVSI